MEIELRRVGEAVVVRLRMGVGERGKIDGVHARVRDHLGAGTKHFIIDLTGCEWIDSSGLGELVKSMATVMRHGGSLRLSGVAPRLRTLLEVTNLTSILDIYTDEEAALASLSN